jgi:SnoaL-like domain
MEPKNNRCFLIKWVFNDNWYKIKLKGMKTVLFVICIFSMVCTIAQTTPGIETKRFYDALNQGDSVMVRSYLSKDVQIIHYEDDTSYSFDLESFLPICSKFEKGLYHENFRVMYETGFPGTDIIEVAFEFILDGVRDHCGRDILYWDEFKITAIHSYSTPCESEVLESYKESLENELKMLIDRWHKAASEAKFDDYFNFMADDFYYLGTDPGERWTKEQFANFCKPYFDKGTAWDFTAFERNFYFSDDHSTVWFDEKLITWMEDCRGSGVLVREKMQNGEDGWGDWKLKHYNLTVTIENEKIKDFIELRKEK